MPDVSYFNLVPITFKWSHWGSNVQVAGSFDSPYTPWDPIKMTKADGSSEFVTILTLKPNATYFYKFVVDGQWVLDQNVPSHPDSGGNFNHVICVEPPPPLASEKELKDDNNNDNEKVENYNELKNSTDNDNEKTDTDNDYEKVEKCNDELKNDNENDNEKVEKYDDELKNMKMIMKKLRSMMMN
ncbi:Carbohydrate-Binding Module Family 48 protein [Gigaspora rosea]|uniref:Carbohydrate-Binding Module Family 48 protein n=1 Tax=Gigaspora rosea TaxID=44941 RepID=A0A397URS3_9GLOM|nr:Carbohydrate-Binding Module Family 48 protein [Gigaspora rosea]